VHLAQAGLPVTVLKNSNVTRLLWRQYKRSKTLRNSRRHTGD